MSKKLLTRELYRQIKKKNQEEMEDFVQNVYKSGFNDADSGARSVNLDDLKKDLSQIKGIGEARLEEIMKVITKHLGEP